MIQLVHTHMYVRTFYHARGMRVPAGELLSGCAAKLCQRAAIRRSVLYLPEHAYATISSPIFVVDSTLDAYQIPCIMGEWRLDPFDVKGG